MTACWAASFDPSSLQHPVLPNRVFSSQVQMGRLWRDFRYRFRLPLVSADVGCLWGDFGDSVSASKNPVPGGQGSTFDLNTWP
jgi:hypothetical protein